ncbi:hypothetical protein [Helicobacter sp. T3_23-1056]
MAIWDYRLPRKSYDLLAMTECLSYLSISKVFQKYRLPRVA